MASIIFAVGFLLFCSRRLLRYLQAFQQDAYLRQRLISWWVSSRAFDTRATIALAGVAVCAGIGLPVLASLAGGVALAILALREEDPRRRAKLRLVMTSRAQRIYWTACASVAGATFAVFAVVPSVFGVAICCIVLAQALPLLLLLADAALTPSERYHQQQYRKEAVQRWQQVAPYTIGITGSYGKTSTKDALGRILRASLAPTFWPPKGTNTLMGITRSIRESLSQHHDYAVVEMAAYGKGSIKRLCEFTPPDAAIITMIGTAHLERFGSREAVLHAKSELAQAVPADGILVCNGDDAGTRRIAEMYPKKTTLLYGFDGADLDCRITHCQTAAGRDRVGTEYTFEWQGVSYQGFTPLIGNPAISNLAAAFTMACTLGADPAYVIAVARHLQPVGNRLQIEQAAGVTYLHDAYNSNPVGFSAALDILEQIPAKRRILVTPGMIELAGDQADEHIRIGRRAAQVCDAVHIVGDTNRDALLSGLRDGGLPRERAATFPTRDAALAALREGAAEGDAVLIENDLPDLYEAKGRY